jgi:hypothetical protein
MSQGFTRGVPIDTDPNLALDSDLVVPSQKAVKDYVDTGLNTKQDTLTDTKSVKIVSNNVELDGDLTTPLANYVYGTNGSGTRGWKPDPTGGGNSIGQLTSPGDVTTPAAITPSQGVTATLDTNYKRGSCGVVFDGQGGTISNGKVAYVQVPYKGEITAWFIAANAIGSCTITVRKDPFGSFPPTTTIISPTPALSGLRTQTSTVSPVIAVAAGDWISFTISGVLTVSWVNLTLSITKTL